MKTINTPNAPQAIWPYSQAMDIWDLIYLSGQIALDKDWNFPHKTIEDQTEQVCKNIWEILKSQNLDFWNVFKTTIFMKNMDDFVKVNEIYWKYFSHKPARSTVEVARLPKDALVEIEVVVKK